MMFQRDLGGVLDLLWRAAHNRTKTGRGHGRCTANLGLAPGFGTRNRGVEFYQTTDGGCRQQEFLNPARGRARHMIQPIADDSRDNARRAIGRSCHHLTTGRVLFVDGHGIGAHPVIDRMRRIQVHAAFGD